MKEIKTGKPIIVSMCLAGVPCNYQGEAAILKARSPSCGKGIIYDGTHSRILIAGNGVTAELLINNGIQVLSEDDL